MRSLKVRGNRIVCTNELTPYRGTLHPSMVTKQSQTGQHAGSLPIIQHASSSRRHWHQRRVGEKVSEGLKGRTIIKEGKQIAQGPGC